MIFWELFWTFFRIGAFTFGGGFAMLPLIQAEVAAKGWLANEELVNFIAVSESTPGPFAVNMSTYVGMMVGGLPGAVCATFGVVLPSFLIILVVATCFEKFRSSRMVSGCMSGLKPAVVGLIGTALLSVGRAVFFPAGLTVMKPEFWVSLGIFGMMLYLVLKKKSHPILVISLSAVLGIAAGYLLQI